MVLTTNDETPWTYLVIAGVLSDPRDGHKWLGCYSGHDQGLDNPRLEQVQGIGPIPRGLYRIGEFYDHPHLGPIVAQLHPVGHNAYGRTGFFIHGDNSHGDQSASHGCIIANRLARIAVRDSKITSLMAI